MKTNKQSVKLHHTIICDDIRKEANNKLILIGVYPEGIIVHHLPAKLEICLWLQFEINIQHKMKLEVHLKGDVLETQPSPIEIEIDDKNLFGKSKIIPLIIGKIPITIGNQGELLIQYKKSEDKAWKKARVINISYQPNQATQ